jgi:CDP-glucose 4,6-dehydratase
MRILVTGHTGFKGSWLSLILNELGHEVSGISLSPEKESHFELSKIRDCIQSDLRGDIRNYGLVEDLIKETDPEFIFHLAAQPLVKASYRDPIYTYEVNVNGTLNVLKAASRASNLRGMLVITTDKVYSNESNSSRAFTEHDALGFGDPYSTSKAMADLLTQSWMRDSKPPIGIARAGNVVGGGDFAADRLIPDLIKNTKLGKPTLIRYPNAVRPWQYVLDCLYGYVLQMQDVVRGNSSIFNFGPNPKEYFEVRQVADGVSSRIQTCEWDKDAEENPYEASFLTLDSTQAETSLNWRNKFNFEETLDLTTDWYYHYLNGKDLDKVSRKQVKEYLNT